MMVPPRHNGEVLEMSEPQVWAMTFGMLFASMLAMVSEPAVAARMAAPTSRFRTDDGRVSHPPASSAAIQGRSSLPATVPTRTRSRRPEVSPPG